ncbi:MAG TPA: glycoside hydrolase family 43 protein [Acidimicrobiales bacterium]
MSSVLESPPSPEGEDTPDGAGAVAAIAELRRPRLRRGRPGARRHPRARRLRTLLRRSPIWLDPRGLDRRQRVVRGLAVVAVLVATQQAWALRTGLTDTRRRLDAARTELADLEVDAERAEIRNDLSARTIELIRDETGFAVAERTWIEDAIEGVRAEIAAVEASRQETDAARQLVDADAAETRACFDGVARAIDANARGDGTAAVEEMRAATGACTRTLAYATGARFPYDFADPFVLRADGAYYAYSTNAGAGDVQVLRSTDLQDWELVGNALAGLPAWARPNATWAPSVLARDGRYVLYYTVREDASNLQCISRAVGAHPTGPFLDDSRGPLVCQREHGGSIDPSPFVGADGQPWLLWKSEGRGSAGAGPVIWSQPLTPDGLGLAFVPPAALMGADRSFERGVVEGPTMVQEGGRFFLLYAAANWSSRHYVTGYAVCAGPAGPCEKAGSGPVLRSGDRLAGPGGAEVFRDASGRLWAAFHAYSEPNVGYPSSRYLHLARVTISGTRLSMAPWHP